MKIIDTNSGKTVVDILTNHSMTLDEAIEAADGKILNTEDEIVANDDCNVIIGNNSYNYDSLAEAREHKISLDNGHSYLTADEAMEEMYSEDKHEPINWEVVVNMMDDDTREQVARMNLDYTDDERHDNELFLAAYLNIADDNLVIG